MARTKKVQLSFNRGALSPHLDGRLDLYQAGNALRTCRNFLVEREGGVKRRPGTRFIAQAGAGIELSHVSYTGSATYYGITELASVSDPPRKYLQLVPNYRAVKRIIDSPAATFGWASINRTVYDLTGTRTEQVNSWAGVSSGSPWGRGAGGSLLSPGDSLESMDWGSIIAPFTDTAPTWQRDRLSKWFTLADFGTPTVDSETEHVGQGFGRLGGLVGTIRGLGVRAVWNSDHWEVGLEMYSDDGSADRQCYMKVANGNQDPGTVTASDTFVLDSSASSQFPSTTVLLPPDCSVRFMVRDVSAGGAVQIPQQIGTTISNGDEAASGLTEDAYDRWIYLAETETLQEEWRFEETLCNEDTLTAAIQRSSDVVTGEASVARTETLTGGTGAESNVPIEWTGTVVQTSKLISGLTIGHRYSVNVTVRSNTIGGADFATTIEAGEEFVALATSTQVTHEVRAGIGKEKRVLNIVALDEGSEPAAPTNYDPDALLWQGKVLANGGTLEADSLQIASDLITALKAGGVWTKLVYFLPFLGSNMLAATVPLRDSASAGNATNTNFVDADFDQATGLQGNGTTKYLTIPRTPNELGASGNGGLFWWELGFAGSGNVEPIGTYNNAATRRFVIDLRSTLRAFRWGDPTNDAASQATAADDAFYHGERRSSTDRELYRNGVSIATDAGADSTTGIGDNDIVACGADIGASVTEWPGRGGCCGCTNGTLSDAEALALYEILRDELMTPTGRT